VGLHKRVVSILTHLPFKCPAFEKLDGSRRPRVLDIACNDGSQLDAFQRLGWETFGVDPAENLVPTCSSKGHHTICAFWDEEVAEKLLSDVGSFDVIIAQNVVAHTANPNSFLKAMSIVANEGTDFYIQTSQRDMLFNAEFDTIYHEHISFFSVLSMKKLVERSGLRVQEVTTALIHGNSFLFRLRRSQGLDETNVNEAVQAELNRGLLQPETRLHFEKSANRTVRILSTLVNSMRGAGIGVVGFGAAAKAMTVLCYGQIRLDYITDESPYKQERLSPGMEIPIRPASFLAADTRPLLIVILAWNFGTEIAEKIKKLRGEKFVTDILVQGYFNPCLV